MNGRKVVLDSNIIIYLSKGQLNIEEIVERYDELCISIITYMEVKATYTSSPLNISTLIDKFIFYFFPFNYISP
jgi:predicted nucleic acid-binding protein